MIAIPVETRLTLTQFLKVAFGGFTSFGLQFSFQAERATIHFFSVFLAQESSLRGDSGTIQAQVHTDDGVVLRNKRFRDRHHYMQIPFPLFRDEISRCKRMADILRTIGRHRKGIDLFFVRGRESDTLFRPIKGVGMHIIARTTREAPRTGDWLEELEYASQSIDEAYSSS